MQLYHASTSAIKGDYLIPQMMENLVRQFYESVYASEKLPAVYGYAMKSSAEGTCEWQTHWEIHDTPYIVLKYRDRLETHPLGTIYPVSGEFKNITLWDGSPTCEWTSTKPVLVDKNNAIKVTSVNEVMEKSVQVFFLDDSISQKEWHQMLNDIGKGFSEHKSFHGILIEPMGEVKTTSEYNQRYLQLTRQLVENGLMVHENAERNISQANLYTGLVDAEPRRSDWAENVQKTSPGISSGLPGH